MAVWVRQLDDGLLSGEYVIAPLAVESDLDLLNRKAASHADKGWVIVWLLPLARFSATKAYPTNGSLVRERIFEIR